MNSMNEPALTYLKSLADQSFWGAVTLKFEEGTIVHLRQEQNLKLSELSGRPRNTNAGHTGK
jgi:hypothetical protein